jgi:hypothetical protein
MGSLMQSLGPCNSMSGSIWATVQNIISTQQNLQNTATTPFFFYQNDMYMCHYSIPAVFLITSLSESDWHTSSVAEECISHIDMLLSKVTEISSVLCSMQDLTVSKN